MLKNGQTAVVFRLPGDQVGAIFDAQDVAARVASALRLVGQVDMTGASKVAVGIGLPSSSMKSIAHVEPDESISRTALDRGADEVAATLTCSLVRSFQKQRR